MSDDRVYREALEDTARDEKALTPEDKEAARAAIEKNFGIHATPLPGDEFTGMFSEHGDRAWAHRLLARHAAEIRKPAFAVKLAQQALHRSK